jgi:3-carboxy-cis,cis-muconate cycloisomerase
MQPNMARLKADCENVGYPIVGLVRQLADARESKSGGYVHWGATTQDIVDTAVVLQVRRGLFRLASALAIAPGELVDRAANKLMNDG